MSFAENLRIARDRRGYTQSYMAEKMGIDKSTYCGYETGKRQPDVEKIKQIAKILGVSGDELLETGFDLPNNIIPMPKMRRIPLIGTIACGTPITAAENYDGDVDMPDNIHADFALRCKGDSMINARIYDGDICYIRQQPTVENGEIAAVLIDDEATLKRIRLYEDHIVLEPENPLYRPLSYWAEDMNSVHILGKAVAFTSSIL